MADLNKLSGPALSAAMRGGTDDWGRAASIHGIRYAEPNTNRQRRRCRCGCNRRETHHGMVNGIRLFGGCEMVVARWVRCPAQAIKMTGRAGDLREAAKLEKQAAKLLERAAYLRAKATSSSPPPTPPAPPALR